VIKLIELNEETNYGLKKEGYYLTVGCALNKADVEEIDRIAKKEGLKRGQLLRKWLLKTLNYEKTHKLIRGW